MRNRVLTFLLGFLSLSLATFAQDTSLGPGNNPGYKFVPAEDDYNAPTRVMNYNSKTGDIDLTYYIGDRRQFFNMCSDNGTFTNVTLLDGGTTGKVTEKNTPVSAFNSEYPDGVYLPNGWTQNVDIKFTDEEQSAMQVGGKIVVRGNPDTGENIYPQMKIVANNDWDNPLTNDDGVGYVTFTGQYEVNITNDNLDALRKGITIQGQNYTLTGLTISSAQENPYHYEHTVGWSTDTPDELTWGSEDPDDPKAYGIHVKFTNDNNFWNHIASGNTLRFEFTDVTEGSQVQVSTYLNGVVAPANFINLTDNGGLGSVTITGRQDGTGYYEIPITADGDGAGAINLVRNYGVYVKGQDAKLKEISVYYKVNEANLGDNYIFLSTYSQKYGKGEWDDTSIKPYYARLGRENNHAGRGTWEDRTIGGENANKPNDWQGNNIRSVTVYCKNNYQMNTNTGNGDGDQQMINGLHPRLLDLTKADVAVEYAQWYTSNPEVDAYKHGENLHKLFDVISHNHTRLVKVRLPENVEAIGFEAFSDCPNLTEVHIPHCTKVIGNNAFGNCPNLTTLKVMRDSDPWGDFNFVQFPKALEYIGNRAFQNDRKLRFENPNRAELNGILSFYIGDVNGGNPDLHYNLKEIGDIAFLNCVNLADTICIPSTVTRIGQGAFRNTTTEAGTIKKIVFNYKPNDYADGEIAKELEIGQYAFSQQPDLYIPDVTWYTDRAPLEKVIFNPGTYAIDAAAFQNDVNLNDLGLADAGKTDVKFTRVGARAFEHCHRLASHNTTVQNIINNVSVDANGRPAIGNNALAYCNGGLLNTSGELIGSVWNSWYEITIPETWKYLPAGLFEHDFNLTNVYVSATTAPVTENTLNDADKKGADLGQSIALTDGSYGTRNEAYYAEHGGQYITDEGAELHYPFYGIVSNRCQLNFTFDKWDEASTKAKETYRAQPGFLYDLLTKYLDEEMIHHETKDKDGVILHAWDDAKMEKYYYCVDQTAADIVLNRTFNKDENNWNTVALPFDIWSKDTYTNAFGNDAVAALYALDADEPLRKDGKTLHFVQMDWGGNYSNIPKGTPFIARHIDTSKAQPKEGEPTEYFYATKTKSDGATVQATATKPVQGYRFANVGYYGANWPNYNEPASNTVTRTESPYAFVGSYILHSKTGVEPVSGVEDPSMQDNRIENAFFIQNNKFYSTEQIADGKLSLKGFRAYFTKSEETGPTTAKQSVLNIGLDENEATGIEQAHIVVANPDGSSVDKAYNLEGQRVNDGYKGVVIVNGKKMIRR